MVNNMPFYIGPDHIVFTPKLAKWTNEDSFMLHLLDMTGCLYYITTEYPFPLIFH